MRRRARQIEVPGYLRFIVVAGLIAALLMLRLSNKQADQPEARSPLLN